MLKIEPSRPGKYYSKYKQLSVGIEIEVYEKIRMLAAKSRMSMSAWAANKLNEKVNIEEKK